MNSEPKDMNYQIIKKYRFTLKRLAQLRLGSKYLKNKGNGAGGANTNINGLQFEKNTSLKNYTIEIRQDNYFQVVKFPGCSKEFISLSKSNLRKYMTFHDEKSDALEAHGTKLPDQCYVDESKKNLFVIEDKFQKVHGSVVEKIQGTQFKINNYKKQYPNYNIRYIFCFSDWFKTNIPAEKEHLDEINVPYFWGEDEDFHQKLIDYICNL
jgi:hypothetical protein